MHKRKPSFLDKTHLIHTEPLPRNLVEIGRALCYDLQLQRLSRLFIAASLERRILGSAAEAASPKSFDKNQSSKMSCHRRLRVPQSSQMMETEVFGTVPPVFK